MENTVTGMNAVVNSLATTLSAENLWGSVASVVPLIGIVVLFTIGFKLIKKVVNNSTNAGSKKVM